MQLMHEGKEKGDALPISFAYKEATLLELVHTNVMGTMKAMSKGGAKHVLIIVEDYLE